MSANDELELWRRQWHSQAAVPIDLIRKVERETVAMRKDRIVSILVTIIIGGGMTVWALLTPSLQIILLACGTWLFIVIVWAFSLANTRGIWSPAARTTASYIDLCIRRCHRKLDALRFSGIIGFLFILFVVIIKPPSDLWDLLFLLSFMIVFSIVMALIFRRQKTQDELTYLLNLQRQLEDRVAPGDTRLPKN